MQNLAEGQIFKEVFPIETTPKKNVHQKFFFEAEACSEMGTYWDRSLSKILKGFFFLFTWKPFERILKKIRDFNIFACIWVRKAKISISDVSALSRRDS